MPIHVGIKCTSKSVSPHIFFLRDYLIDEVLFKIILNK